MREQLDLFETSIPAAPGQLTERERAALATGPPSELPRLNRQCQAILDRLRAGPATNAELYAIAFNATARLSDLRRAGHAIEAKRRSGGVWVYQLKHEA